MNQSEDKAKEERKEFIKENTNFMGHVVFDDGCVGTKWSDYDVAYYIMYDVYPYLGGGT